MMGESCVCFRVFGSFRPFFKIQYTLDLRKPDLRKNLDLRKIVGATEFLVNKMFDLRKIF
jgi:hypothetical protein